MKRNALFAALVFGAALAYAQNGAPSAAQIMERAKTIGAGSTMMTRSRMVITAKNGSTSERVIDQYSKDDAKGHARTVIVFQSPATVKNTRFLTIDKEGGGSDQWIFMPSLGKVRRIAASEGSGTFMGTDFSYDDMAAMDRDVNKDTHTLLREETLKGAACFVIQSIAKDADYQYGKTITWVDKANSRVYRSEMYDKKGNTMLKVSEMSGYETISGYDTPRETKISTIASGTSTTIYMDRIEYDKQIPERVFTTAYLESGR
jgi:outer membrane lipoprotein-sorting protein